MPNATLEKMTSDYLSVGMGQIVVVTEGQFARAVLGSCIGLVLYDESQKIASMAHIVLNDSKGASTALPGKFANTAIPAMLELLSKEGVGRNRLQAKIAGGAAMFGKTGPIQIGKNNEEAVKELLAALNIPLRGEHVGGDKGRRVTFDPATAGMQIDAAGNAVASI